MVNKDVLFYSLYWTISLISKASHGAKHRKLWITYSSIFLGWDCCEELHKRYCSASSSNTCWAMNNSFLIFSRVHIPINEFEKHPLKICQCLSTWNSMIRPSKEVNLCDISKWTIAQNSLQFSSHKILTFSNISKYLYWYFFRIWWILRNISFFRFIIGPKLIAFVSTIFFCSACTHNHSDIIFDDHLPKMRCCLR